MHWSRHIYPEFQDLPSTLTLPHLEMYVFKFEIDGFLKLVLIYSVLFTLEVKPVVDIFKEDQGSIETKNSNMHSAYFYSLNSSFTDFQVRKKSEFNREHAGVGIRGD